MSVLKINLVKKRKKISESENKIETVSNESIPLNINEKKRLTVSDSSLIVKLKKQNKENDNQSIQNQTDNLLLLHTRTMVDEESEFNYIYEKSKRLFEESRKKKSSLVLFYGLENNNREFEDRELDFIENQRNVQRLPERIGMAVVRRLLFYGFTYNESEKVDFDNCDWTHYSRIKFSNNVPKRNIGRACIKTLGNALHFASGTSWRDYAIKNILPVPVVNGAPHGYIQRCKLVNYRKLKLFHFNVDTIKELPELGIFYEIDWDEFVKKDYDGVAIHRTEMLIHLKDKEPIDPWLVFASSFDQDQLILWNNIELMELPMDW